MKKNLYVIFFSLSFSAILWMSISLSNNYSTNLKLPIKFFNLPKGYTTASASTQNINVTVRGKGWDIITAMLTTPKDYFVDAGGDTRKKKTFNLNSFVSDNAWLTSKLQIVEFAPDTITFTFEEIGYTKMKIVPDIKIEFKPEYGLASDLSVMPESTLASGPSNLVKMINEIPTETIILKDLSEKTEQIVRIKKITGLVYETQAVKVTFDVQRIVEKSFDEISVNVLDIPVDRDVVLLPNKINIQLRGGIDVLGKLNKDKLSAHIYYRDIVLDTIGYMIPVVSIPKHTELVYIRPNQLNYIIKKYKK
jgi:hypothetical protein